MTLNNATQFSFYQKQVQGCQTEPCWTLFASGSPFCVSATHLCFTAVSVSKTGNKIHHEAGSSRLAAYSFTASSLFLLHLHWTTASTVASLHSACARERDLIWSLIQACSRNSSQAALGRLRLWPPPLCFLCVSFCQLQFAFTPKIIYLGDNADYVYLFQQHQMSFYCTRVSQIQKCWRECSINIPAVQS